MSARDSFAGGPFYNSTGRRDGASVHGKRRCDKEPSQHCGHHSCHLGHEIDTNLLGPYYQARKAESTPVARVLQMTIVVGNARPQAARSPVTVVVSVGARDRHAQILPDDIFETGHTRPSVAPHLSARAWAFLKEGD